MDEPWQQFIITGPITVNLLGQLMLVSSKLDFSFRRFSPNYHFEHMKYPDSFRATLTQISHGQSISITSDQTKKNFMFYLRI